MTERVTMQQIYNGVFQEMLYHLLEVINKPFPKYLQKDMPTNLDKLEPIKITIPLVESVSPLEWADKFR